MKANAINNEIEITASPGTDHTASGVSIELTNNTGGTINFGDICVFHTTAHEVALADADLEKVTSCICIESSVTNTNSGKFLVLGVVRDDTWTWTIGGVIYMSTTAGSMSQTAPILTGDFVQVVGAATSADTMFFNPSPVLIKIA